MTAKRKPSASPVCYADDPEIDPAYMWAQPKPKAKAEPKSKVARAKRKPAGKGGKR